MPVLVAEYTSVLMLSSLPPLHRILHKPHVYLGISTLQVRDMLPHRNDIIGQGDT